jgi:hypothetical protein
MVTRVVHVRSRLWQETPPEQRVYVGRRAAEFPASKWGNPYRVGVHGNLSAVLYAYRCRLTHADELAIRAELAGKTLGCWCAPKSGYLTALDRPLSCHGQVLADVADGDLPVSPPVSMPRLWPDGGTP